VETKNTFILDLTGTLSAIFGLISLVLYQLVGIQVFDAIGAIMIGVLIIITSIVLIWGVKDYLIGKTASPETKKSIREVVLNIKEVTKIISLDTMYIGSEKLLVLLDIDIKPIKKDAIGELVERIKTQVKKEVPLVNSIQVEIRTPE
jgi:divalent metal cation (Fe/Co/Zn/Cd) transporter